MPQVLAGLLAQAARQASLVLLDLSDLLDQMVHLVSLELTVPQVLLEPQDPMVNQDLMVCKDQRVSQVLRDSPVQ